MTYLDYVLYTGAWVLRRPFLDGVIDNLAAGPTACAQQAVLWPHQQRRLALRLELLRIPERLGEVRSHPRPPYVVLHVPGANDGPVRRGLACLGVLPVGGVGNVCAVVRVERDVELGDLGALGGEELGDAEGGAFGVGDGAGAAGEEVDLWVDDEEGEVWCVVAL